MNPQSLKDNALFLSCWYERSRPVQLICFGIMILSILLLSFLNITLNEINISRVLESLFYVIAWIQTLVLLAQGTLFASHLASRERTSETLDFHRNSPQPVKDKIVGLVFGSTWFEWAIFSGFFIIELPFALLRNIQITQVLLFNLSLLLSGIFFHTTAVAISLLSTQKKRGSSIFALLLVLFFVGPLFLSFTSTSSSTFISHLLGFTAYQHIYLDKYTQFNGRFYNLEFPLIVMQAIVQMPLFLLMVNGMKRIFCLPNSPAWSKEHVIYFCAFLF